MPCYYVRMAAYIGIGIAVVALVMAVQPFTQAIWGRPKLIINLKPYRKNGVQGLICEIGNPPIESRLLRGIQVHRSTAEDVVANLGITEHHSQKRVFGVVPHIDKYTGDRAQRVTLPASKIPNWFGIVIFDGNSVKPGFDASIPDVLNPGLYDVLVRVESAEHRYSKRGQFVVQTETPLAYWVE